MRWAALVLAGCAQVLGIADPRSGDVQLDVTSGDNQAAPIGSQFADSASLCQASYPPNVGLSHVYFPSVHQVEKLKTSVLQLPGSNTNRRMVVQIGVALQVV